MLSMAVCEAVSTGSKAAIHLVFTACCDPSYSSPAPEIAASLWERSATANCLMSATSAVEGPKSILLGCSSPFLYLGPVSQEALHYLPATRPQEMSKFCMQWSPYMPCSPVKSCTWVKLLQAGHRVAPKQPLLSEHVSGELLGIWDTGKF